MPGQSPARIEPLGPELRAWMAELMTAEWGAPRIVSRGRVYDTREHPGFVAMQGARPAGVIVYRIEGGECEILALNSLVEGLGIGARLVTAVAGAARAAGCRRVWLITTNDNLRALRFYQRSGFRIVTVYPNALDESRRLKPEIPLVGLDGIPLRDEIELELRL